MNTREHIIKLLAQGLPTSAIAAATGVTDAYVSQLRGDPEVQDAVNALAAAASQQDLEFDSKLERAEAKALDKIEANLPFANMGQALAAFRILNTAKKRRDPTIIHDPAGTTVNVTLTLPVAAMPHYVVNQKAEIVEVEGKTMISATPKSLDEILRQRALAAGQAVPALPSVTAMERAADMLGGLSVPAPRAKAHKLPAILSTDIL